MVARLGSRTPMVVGAAIAALGYGLLLRLGASSAFARMLPAFVMIPGGMGLGVPAMTTAILAAVDKAWSGTASAVLNAARQAGGAVGVAAFGLATGALGPVGGLHGAAAASGLLLLAAAAISAVWVEKGPV
jgi:DHA2 family methylenomycin A resistance protein-like MFS transporter